MQPKEDAAYLWDMLDGARTIVQMTTGVEFDQYLTNRMMQLAVERGIEILGEAARGVSDSFQQAHPEIPWRPIIAQRHILAHEYGSIQPDRIWRVVTIHIPALIALLEPLVPSPPSSNPPAVQP
jgi:uncharacterized protein with HEPN domain